MTSIEVTAKADAEGKVHLDLPTGAPHAQVKIRATLEVSDRRRASTREEYLAFIDRIYGAISDPSFERPPQGELPEVEAL